MILSWALDNSIWGVQNQAGWHATNLFLLSLASFLVFVFINQFIKKTVAVYTGTALFMFSYPMAVAVARVSWRTTILALIPFLLSIIIVSIWSRSSKGKWMPFAAAFLYLVSLLIKETAVAALPVMVMVAYCSAPDIKRLRKAVWAFAVALIPLLVYGLLRYRAMGFGVNYAESSSFGFFMAKNLILQNAVVWQPWLSGISARVLLLLYPIAIYFVVPRWKNRLLVFVTGTFLMLPVSNLTLRPDFSVAALPGAALFLGFLTERIHRKRFLYPILFVFFAGIVLFSRDEIKTLKLASNYVEKTTIRLAEIAEELPGNGPLFLSGVDRTVGVYGTFWPGEYMIPMQCLGIHPGRFVTGTDRIWEALTTESDPGFLIFMADDAVNYTSVQISADMYTELPDTTESLSGCIPAGRLIRYPSCRGSDGSVSLQLISPMLQDSVLTIYPEFRDGFAYYDLAAVPLWLTANEATVIITEKPAELTFSSKNMSLDEALNTLASKAEEN